MAVAQSLKNPAPLVGLPHGLLGGFLVPGRARGGEGGEDFQGDFCDIRGDVLPTHQVGLVADAADDGGQVAATTAGRVWFQADDAR